MSKLFIAIPLGFLSFCCLAGVAPSVTAQGERPMKREPARTEHPEQLPVVLKGLEVIAFVHDLEAAKDMYRDTLGFTLPPRGAVSPLGTLAA